MPNERVAKPVRWTTVVLIGLMAIPLLSTAAAAQTGRPPRDWRRQIQVRLPQLGHRNWIVVADSAYPAQSREGIETVYIGGDQAAAVAEVLAMVEQAPHVRGVVYLDQELRSVPEADAPGVDAYRKRLDELLAGKDVKREPHEEIIEELDEAAKTFRVLVVKTDCTIPYTSVFVQLDCGYWSAEQEQRLRAAMED